MTKIEGALGLLSKGTKEWNVYLSALRDKEFNSNSEPEIIIENTTFKDLDIEGAKFSYVTFRHCVFNNCLFSSCEWEGAKFVECQMDVALFVDGSGEYLKIVSSKVKNCKFVNIQMGEGGFFESNFDDVDFQGCTWDGDEFAKCVFSRCIVVDCSLQECEFESCRFHFSNLWHSTFRHCSFDDVSLSGLDFMNIMGNSSLRFPLWYDAKEAIEEEGRSPDGSKFLSCSFSGSDLKGLDFGCSDFGGSSFFRTNLSGGNLVQCSGLSVAGFDFCDVSGAVLPPNINFDTSVSTLRDLGASLQRLSYFCVAFCISAILGSISELEGEGVRFPLAGWDLQPEKFGVVISVMILVLQMMVMARSDNLACRASRLPAMLQNGAPLPTTLRDSFIADLAWRFLYTPTMYRGFARRSYAWMSIPIAFLVLYFQFPIAVLCLYLSAVFHSQGLILKSIILVLLLVSFALAAAGAYGLIGSFRRLSITGRIKEQFN